MNDDFSSTHNIFRHVYDEVIKHRFEIEIHRAEQKKTSFKLDSSSNKNYRRCR